MSGAAGISGLQAGEDVNEPPATLLAPLPGGQVRQGDEEIELVWLPFEEALRRVLAGEITESVSVAGILKTFIQNGQARS